MVLKVTIILSGFHPYSFEVSKASTRQLVAVLVWMFFMSGPKDSDLSSVTPRNFMYGLCGRQMF